MNVLHAGSTCGVRPQKVLGPTSAREPFAWESKRPLCVRYVEYCSILEHATPRLIWTKIATFIFSLLRDKEISADIWLEGRRRTNGAFGVVQHAVMLDSHWQLCLGRIGTCECEGRTPC